MYAIEVEDLRKTYHGGHEALRGISLKIAKGDFFALLGPNGAGKSTLIGILCSLVRKTGGRCRILGIDIDQNMPQAKSLLGIVPQEFNLNIFEPPLQILINQAGYYGVPPRVARQRAEQYLEKLGLKDKAKTPTRMLSGGMKRRLMIARALVHEPPILILDEPTAGVDVELRRLIWNFLTELNAAGKTIVLTTHYLEEAEALCRNLAIIDEGKIVLNTTKKKLLAQLAQRTYVVELARPCKKLPTIKEFPVVAVDASTLEATLQRGQDVHLLFKVLDRKQLTVHSIREKTNRLEQLFLELTGKKEFL
ncbi:MAG: ABC transporter ATP-binding protein [Turneriella sp.]|nr:ABC transporter ATP-binding protein [Turneriella sp.]